MLFEAEQYRFLAPVPFGQQHLQPEPGPRPRRPGAGPDGDRPRTGNPRRFPRNPTTWRGHSSVRPRRRATNPGKAVPNPGSGHARTAFWPRRAGRGRGRPPRGRIRRAKRRSPPGTRHRAEGPVPACPPRPRVPRRRPPRARAGRPRPLTRRRRSRRRAGRAPVTWTPAPKRCSRAGAPQRAADRTAGDTGSTLPVVLACSAAEATPLAVLTPGNAASLANGKARASTTSAVNSDLASPPHLNRPLWTDMGTAGKAASRTNVRCFQYTGWRISCQDGAGTITGRGTSEGRHIAVRKGTLLCTTLGPRR